jgi:hypothetical protein
MWALCVNYASSLVGATSNTAGAILGARETLLVAGLLVGAGRLGGASSALLDDVALVDGVLLVRLCCSVSKVFDDDDRM